MCTIVGMRSGNNASFRMRAEYVPQCYGIYSARIRNTFRCGIPENSTHGFMYSCYCIHWLFVIPESVHTPCPLFLKVYTNIQIIAQMTGDKHERRPPS